MTPLFDFHLIGTLYASDYDPDSSSVKIGFDATGSIEIEFLASDSSRTLLEPPLSFF